MSHGPLTADEVMFDLDSSRSCKGEEGRGVSSRQEEGVERGESDARETDKLDSSDFGGCSTDSDLEISVRGLGLAIQRHFNRGGLK